MAWLQVIFGNALLSPVSFSNFTGPERGIFCVSIFDIISRSVPVVFSMLRPSNYYYNKGPVCYVFSFYSHYCYSELSIFFLFILLWDTSSSYIYYYCPFIYFYSVIIIMCYLKLQQNITSLTNIKSVSLWYFEHNFSSWQRNPQLSNVGHQQHWFLLSKPSDHWNIEHYRGPADHGEGDSDLDINRLASGNLWQYTTLPSQFERLTWTWTCCLLYFDCWYHF